MSQASTTQKLNPSVVAPPQDPKQAISGVGHHIKTKSIDLSVFVARASVAKNAKKVIVTSKNPTSLVGQRQKKAS